jgi:peptide deformylase
MNLEILEFPDERLRRVCEPVTTFDAELKALVDDMFQTMYAAPGVGLAAIQVNVPIRMMVIDVEPQDRPRPLVFVNPHIVATEGEVAWEEGCLSVPGFTAEVERAEKVFVRAQDVNGVPFELEADGLLAIAIQHENDHLEGVLFVDHLSRLKRQLFMKKYQKIQAQKQRA